MPPGDRPRDEKHRVRTNRIPALTDRLEQVGEGPVRARDIQPVRQAVDEQPSRLGRARRGRPQALVALGVAVPVVERDAEQLADGRVEGALQRVQRVRDDGQVEQQGRVDVVEQGVGGAPLVGEQGVRARRVEGEGFPLRVVGGRGGGVGGRRRGVGAQEGDFRHGGDADDAFDGEVGLVDELAGEVVGRELLAGREGEVEEVGGELLELGVVGGEVGGVGGESGRVVRCGRGFDDVQEVFDRYGKGGLLQESVGLSAWGILILEPNVLWLQTGETHL